MSNSSTRTTLAADFRRQFEEQELLYAAGEWKAPSSCVWNCNTEIPGRVALEELYPDLRGFFVGKLKVQPITPELVLNDLINAASQKVLDRTNIRSLILALGQSIHLAKDVGRFEAKVKSLKRTAFLPVSSGGKFHFSKPNREDYYIIDHERF